MKMNQERAQKILKESIEQAMDYIVNNSENPTEGYKFLLDIDMVKVGFGSTLSRQGYSISAGLVNNKNANRVENGFKAIKKG